MFLKKNQDCCYDIVFDKNNELCCNLHVYSIDGSQKTVCCGNESIDSRNYFCNNGTPFVKDSFWNGMYIRVDTNFIFKRPIKQCLAGCTSLNGK